MMGLNLAMLLLLNILLWTHLNVLAEQHITQNAEYPKQVDEAEVDLAVKQLQNAVTTESRSGLALNLDVWNLLKVALKNDELRIRRNVDVLPPREIYSKSNLDLVNLGGKNYFFSKNQKLSWIDSAMFCRLYGMNLASIETREEDQLIVKHLKDIGLTPHVVWISGNKIGRSTYLWMNGEQLIFENWHPGAPPHFATEHCMLYQNDHWTDYHCSGHEWFFICEEP